MVAKGLERAGNRFSLIVTDTGIAEDEHSRGEHLLQGGDVVAFSGLDGARQLQEILHELIERLLVLGETLRVQLISQHFLVFFQRNIALHEDPSRLIPLEANP